MIVTTNTRQALAARREERRMTARGFRKHETDWEIHRGDRQGEVITEARVSVCGKYVWTRLAAPPVIESTARQPHEAELRSLIAEEETAHRDRMAPYYRALARIEALRPRPPFDYQWTPEEIAAFQASGAPLFEINTIRREP